MRSGMPINPLSSGRQPFGRPRNSFLSALLTKRNILIALIIFSLLIIIAIGQSNDSEQEEEELRSMPYLRQT